MTSSRFGTLGFNSPASLSLDLFSREDLSTNEILDTCCMSILGEGHQSLNGPSGTVDRLGTLIHGLKR